MSSKHDAVKESLSALLDDEHKEIDLRRVLKEKDDAVVNQSWASYTLTRQVMQKEVSARCDAGFAAAVSAAIAEEPLPASSSQRQNIAQSLTGKVAVAACFTLAVLIGVDQWAPVDQEQAQDSVVADAPAEPAAIVPSGFELPPLNARTVSNTVGADYALPVQPSALQSVKAQEMVLSPELQQELSRLMFKHAENASANGGLSITPFTRVGTVKTETE